MSSKNALILERYNFEKNMYMNLIPDLMIFLLKKKINVSKIKSKYSLNITINV